MSRTFSIASSAALAVLLAALSFDSRAHAGDARAIPAARIAPQAVKKEKIVKVEKTPEEWKKILTSDQYRVLREQGTETAFTGKYWNNHTKGVYLCAGCGLELFSSDTKFDSGTGWPSFWQPIAASHVTDHRDTSYGMVRDEVTCARCGGHLGHVFDDGPPPTHQRYCINSAALTFEPRK